MPFVTPIYGLEAHIDGEVYSATIDRRRFTIIDNQMAFFTDIIGNGRINDWAVTVEDLPLLKLKISEGSGLIDKFGIFTYGPFFVTVGDNRTSYLYMRRKNGIIGGFSGFSEIKNIIVVDSTPPSVPSGLSITPSYSENVLNWIANTEIDIHHYNVYRSFNNIDFTKISESENNNYTDSGLEQDTNYYYSISAIDINGNESSTSSAVLSKTLKDLRQPLPISILQAFSRDSCIQLFWELSASDNVAFYQVVTQRLDEEMMSVGASMAKIIDADKNFAVVTDLFNGVSYQFIVYAISENDVLSAPISTVAVPAFNRGPSEIEDVNIQFSAGDNEDGNVKMEICVSFLNDPYVVQPDRLLATIIENGTSVSEPIPFNRGSLCKTITVIPFLNSAGQIAYRSVKEKTRYIVKIQGVDTQGVTNLGVVSQTSSPVFKNPPPISSLSAVLQDDLSLYISWINSPTNILSHNTISVISIDLSNSTETLLVDNTNIGVSSSFVLTSDNITDNRTYRFEIRAEDLYGNRSQLISIDYTIPEVNQEDTPNPPINQKVIAGDRQVKIKWDIGEDYNNIRNYSIWRANFTFFPRGDDFTRIDTIPSNYSEYTDYTVLNGQRYMYFISAIDFFGVESDNPSNLNLFTYTFLYAFPQANATLSVPDGLTVVQSGFDAQLSWTASSGVFDGYEIWRSIGNLYSFELIDSVSVSSTSYTDEDALIKSNTSYYYMIRKFRNEAEPFLTESSTAPQGSIILATITTNNGSITIDETPAIELLNLADPVRTETRKQLALHKHNIDEQGNDKRIDLSDNITVLATEWTTDNYQTYTTTQDIGEASAYLVRINGEINEDFFKDSNGNINGVAIELLKRGIPPFLFDINADDNEIVFQFPLYSELASESVPFKSAPEISVKLIDVSEITGNLTNNRIEEVNATQVTSGRIDLNQLASIHHDGRMNEELIPVQDTMQSTDLFNWSFATTELELDDTVSFYDVIKRSDDNLVAVTSRGILTSDDFGVNWKLVKTTVTAPHKLHYSPLLSRYFAITNNEVYVSFGNLESWSLVDGIGNVKVIRDIISDSDGNVYVSTDLGVYKLSYENSERFFSFEQTPIFGPRSTEAYALLNDTINNRILVSNELGILESTTAGILWTFTDEFDELKKIYSFVIEQNVIFALTGNALYRKTNGNFVKISDLEVTQARHLVIYQERLWITTEKGVYASEKLKDIINESEVNFVKTLPEININHNEIPATGLSVIDDVLFVGTEQRLFTVKGKKVSLQYEDSQGSVPTVFVNKVKQNIGVRYNTDSNIISFDEKIGVNLSVSVARKYFFYIAKHGGWAHQNYLARLKLRQNNTLIADSNDISGGIPLDVAQFTDFQFPDFDETNSHSSGASKYQSEAEIKIDRLAEVIDGSQELSAGEKLSDIVSSIYFSLEQFLSQLFKNARVITTEDDEGDSITNVVELPPIIVNLNSQVKYDISNGKFDFTKEYRKYDNLIVDIFGVTIKNIGEYTHTEIEDTFELFNSGLPSSLSQVQQINIVKMGLFNERIWPGEQVTEGSPYQAEFHVPSDKSWYDSLNSSVDWTISSHVETINPTITHVASAIHIADIGSVLIGGTNGAYLINATTFNFTPVIIDSTKNINVKHIYSKNSKIYVVTEEDIYVSSDNTETWIKIDRTGLPIGLFVMASIHNALLVGTTNGIYYQLSEEDGWTLAIESDKPVEIMYDPDLVFAIVDSKPYYSSDGINWISTGTTILNSINGLSKFKGIIFAATDKGLYKDDGTFYGSNAVLSLVDTMADIPESKLLSVNDIASDGERLLVGLSDGRALMLDTGGWQIINDLPLKAVHKVLVVDSQIWLFGYDLLLVLIDMGAAIALMWKIFTAPDWDDFDAEEWDTFDGTGQGVLISYTSYPIKLTTGAPL